MAILLAQLQNDGYSIFIVSGDLPKSPAEEELLLRPLNVREVLANQKPISGARGSGKKSRGGGSDDDDDNDNMDDDELKRAIKMSLIENDIDLDRNRMAYPSLAHEQIQITDYGQLTDEDDELKRAIALSLQTNFTAPQASGQSGASNVPEPKPSTSGQIETSKALEPKPSPAEELDKEAIRNKRLAFLEKQQNQPSGPK